MAFSTGHAPIPSSSTLDAAYAHCASLAHAHYENFTVVSWLFPKELRRHLHAIYAFCRHTDDLGDEAHGDRLLLLDEWEQDLEDCYFGEPSHIIMVALQDTIHQFNIPDLPFRMLIEANRIDQRQHRYPTYQDLLSYCQHSANPVGRIVLYLLGYSDAARQRFSDATCTALQLTNFWQDVRRDYAVGRVYLPLEDMDHFGYTEKELTQNLASDAFRKLLRFEVERTEPLYREGYSLIELLPGKTRLDMALFNKGGLSVLETIRRQDYDVLSQRPTVSKGRKLWMTLSTTVRLGIFGHA